MNNNQGLLPYSVIHQNSTTYRIVWHYSSARLWLGVDVATRLEPFRLHYTLVVCSAPSVTLRLLNIQ